MKDLVGDPSVEFLKQQFYELKTKHEREIKKIYKFYNELIEDHADQRAICERHDLVTWLKDYSQGLRAINDPTLVMKAHDMADALNVVIHNVSACTHLDYDAKSQKDNKGWEFFDLNTAHQHRGELN